MLQNQLVQKIIKQLDVSYLTDMLSYVVNTTQDENEPQAARHLIKELIQAFPEQLTRRTIMSFAQQLKEEHKQEFMSTFAQQLKEKGLQQGRKKERYEMAKNLLAEGLPLDLVKKVTKLPDLDLTELASA